MGGVRTLGVLISCLWLVGGCFKERTEQLLLDAPYRAAQKGLGQTAGSGEPSEPQTRADDDTVAPPSVGDTTPIAAGNHSTPLVPTESADAGVAQVGYVDDADSGVCPSERALHVSTFGQTTCALMESHTVRCWGANYSGAVGDGTLTDRNVATPVKGLTGVKQIDLGYLRACAVIDDGTLRCWGNNDWGALRNGNDVDQTEPVVAQGLSDVVQVSAGETQTCVRHSDNTLECWLYVIEREGVLDADGATGVIDVEAGYFRTTAFFADGSHRTWGQSDFLNGQRIKRITSSYGDVCALLLDGGVLCGGSPVAGLNGVADIAAGFDHTCALLRDGTVSCWGNSARGQLGNPNGSGPRKVVGLDHIVQIASGRDHSCALRADGAVFCWGANEHGELGDGTNTERQTPVAVIGL